MSLFVIPMAGLSSRFFKAGYQQPKYMLPLHGRSMFEWSVSSFEAYYLTDPFLFIVRDVFDTPLFVENMARKLGIKNYQIVVLNSETRGQADTVYLGMQTVADDQDIVIFNIDSCRINYRKPQWIGEADGYLEVFQGEGEHWSFIEPEVEGSLKVLRTTEKERISDYCSDGLYYFRSKALFDEAFKDAVAYGKYEKGELYVAPLYNYLVKNQKDVRYDLISGQQIQFCGTPDEYIALLSCAQG